MSRHGSSKKQQPIYNKGYKVKRVDDDSALTEEEWPTTCEHNKEIFRELKPNAKMMKKIYQVLYYEKSKIPLPDRNAIVNIYDIKITPHLQRRILEQSLRGRKPIQRERYKTYTMDEYLKKIEDEAKDITSYNPLGLNVIKKKIEITFD